jgi:NADH-quinone oxidoreductase subunit L
MGGLRKYMPVTWITSLVGSLALIGTPFFAGFYSKDSIIIAAEAAHEAGKAGAGFAYYAVLIGVFVTAFYSFRMYFLVFHGKERFGQAGDHAHNHHGDHDDEEPSADHHHGLAPGEKPHESPAVVWVPLALLAIPSLLIGFVTVDTLLFKDYFKNALFVNTQAHPAMKVLAEDFHGPVAMALHGFMSAPFFLALAGVVLAWYFYLVNPAIPAAIQRQFSAIYRLLDNKYYMDRINEIVFAGGARLLGTGLWKGGDVAIIDGVAVNGSARLVGWFAGVVRHVQSGYIYHYAFAMLLGIAVVLFFFMTLPYVWRVAGN